MTFLLYDHDVTSLNALQLQQLLLSNINFKCFIIRLSIDRYLAD